MRVMRGDGQIGGQSPLRCEKRAVGAFQNIKRAVRFAPDGDVGFAVAPG